MTDCKHCCNTGRVEMSVGNPYGHHKHKHVDCPVCRPAPEVKELESLRFEVKKLKAERDSLFLLLTQKQEKNADIQSKIKEALDFHGNCGASERWDSEYGDVYVVDPQSFNGIGEKLMEIIAKSEGVTS